MIFCAVFSAVSSQTFDEATAKKFLEDLDPNYLRAANKQMKVRWEYITNINEANANAQVIIFFQK